jgi:hypothetical protein
LTSHSVDGDERALELLGLGELVEQIGDGGDLVGDGVDGAPTASNVPRWMLSQTI